MKNKTGLTNNLTVKCIPSTPGLPTSGKIIVEGQGVYKEIPAVIFTLEQSKELSAIADKYYENVLDRKK